MPKQLVPIQMGAGINTKPDPKQLQAGQLLTLQNGQFSKIGQLNKRFGYDILNTTIEGGGALTSAVELANYKNELLLFDGNNVYTYLPATGNWSNRGTAISITTEDKDIIRLSAAQQLNPDMAYLKGMEVFAWEDSRGGVRYSTLDSTTKAFALSDGLVNIVGQQPKCIAFQNQVFIFYSDGNSTLYYVTINPLNPTAISAPTAIITDGFNGLNAFPYDVTVIGAQMFVGYLGGSPSTGAIRLFYLDAAYNKSATTVVDATPGQAINPGYHGAITLCGDTNSDCWISWANGVDARTAAYNYSLSTNLLPVTLIAGTSGSVISTMASVESPTPLTILIAAEIFNATPSNTKVGFATVSINGLVNVPHNPIKSVGIASKFFKYNGNTYLNGAYQSTLQSTDFTFLIANSQILSTPVIVAKETPSVGGGLQTNGMIPETVTLSSGVFKFANLQAGKIISEANTVFSILGVNSTKLIFTPSDNFVNTQQANTLLIVGGILQSYDGVSVVETGFHLYPEDVVYTPGGSGSLGTGTYQYMVQYEWTDNNGQIYRSAPSVPTSVQVTAGQAVSITGPMLRLTAKVAPRTAPSIVIYRTAANGITFNRVTSTLAPLLNNTTQDTFTFVDSLSDTAASSNELNYTEGGVLANIAPPANAIITTYNDRVFLAGLSDKLLMWYSQSVVDNSNSNTIPPQFCAELNISCDPRGGDISALGLLNNALIIFKQTNIFALQGNGPDATGNNNDFGDPSLITSDVGCINDNSVVIMPQGLMFQSEKGIYLLDQSLTLSYIGAPVEAFNSYTITSSTLNPNANQVIFCTAQGTALVYDYYMQQWSTWTNHYALDSAVYNGNFCFVNKIGQVYVQNQNKFTDGSVPVYMSFTLPNLAFAGIQDYQRVYRVFILGTYKGPHTLNVSVAYDYNDNYTQFTTINPSANVSTWGSDQYWGQNPYWGGQYQIYEFRVDFAIQKCTAIRLMIADNQTSVYNEGYAISSIVFEVGTMPGGNRLPTSNTYGAK